MKEQIFLVLVVLCVVQRPRAIAMLPQPSAEHAAVLLPRFVYSPPIVMAVLLLVGFPMPPFAGKRITGSCSCLMVDASESEVIGGAFENSMVDASESVVSEGDIESDRVLPVEDIPCVPYPLVYSQSVPAPTLLLLILGATSSIIKATKSRGSILCALLLVSQSKDFEPVHVSV